MISTFEPSRLDMAPPFVTWFQFLIVRVASVSVGESLFREHGNFIQAFNIILLIPRVVSTTYLW